MLTWSVLHSGLNAEPRFMAIVFNYKTLILIPAPMDIIKTLANTEYFKLRFVYRNENI